VKGRQASLVPSPSVADVNNATVPEPLTTGEEQAAARGVAGLNASVPIDLRGNAPLPARSHSRSP
jgi:hypothetical protein